MSEKDPRNVYGVFLALTCHYKAALLVSFMSSTPSTSSNDQNEEYFHHDGRFLQKKEHKMPILVDRTEFTIHNFVTCLVFAHSHKVTQFNYQSHSSRRLRARTSSTKTRRTSSGTSTTTTTTLSTTCGSNLSRSGNTSTAHHHFSLFAGLPLVRHIELEMFHLSKTKKRIVPVCKDLSRVGLADSPQMDGYNGGYAGLSKMKQQAKE